MYKLHSNTKHIKLSDTECSDNVMRMPINVFMKLEDIFGRKYRFIRSHR